jgi:Heparinase II/III-like protein/Heparinase II/III N-terminus
MLVRGVPALVAGALAGTVWLATAFGSAGGSDLSGLRHASCPAPVRPAPLGAPSEKEIQNARIDHLFKLASYPTRLVSPVYWRQDPHHSTRFRSALASLVWTHVLLYDYHHNHEVGALRQARDLMLDWIRHQPFRGSHTSRNAWVTKVVGDRAVLLGYMTRAAACEHLLPRRSAKAALRSLHAHAQWLLGHRVSGNHDLFDSLGLLALGRDLSFSPQAGKWRRIARRRFVTTFDRRVYRQEGFWLENSSSYQFLLTDLLRRFVPIAGPHHPGIAGLLERMEQVGGWLIEPDHHIVQFGESDLLSPSAVYQRRSEEDRGLLALMASGLAVVKEPGSFLSVLADFHNGTHKQSDDLSFDLFDDGHRIVSDTGEYQQDPGRIRNFVTAARAHSTLTVDGRGFPRAGRFAYGSGLRATGAGDGWFAIEAANPLLRRQGVTHTRFLLYKPGVALIVADRVRSSATHSYDRYFQLGPDIDIAAQGPQQVQLLAPGLSGTLYSESDVGTETRFSARGQSSPLAGWTSPTFRTLVPRWTLDLRSSGEDADYATTISLDSSELHAHLGSIGASRAAFDLTQGLLPAGAVEVTRSGQNLTVTQTGP